MQELFARETSWHVPWAHRTAPFIRRLVRHRPERTVFTRFLPPERPDDMPGSWRRFYTRWAEMTRGAIEPALLELVPMLAEFVYPRYASTLRVPSESAPRTTRSDINDKMAGAFQVQSPTSAS